MNLCILFPGIGYHCDKPLLYYTAKLARSRGYEVIPLRFTDFPDGAKGNDEKMRAAAAHALTQSEQQLSGVNHSSYDRIIFAGKSIGTAACLAYRATHDIPAECILLTPLEMTFDYPSHACTAFHGTSDQWADTAEIERLCTDNSVPLKKYETANHSLETGDPTTDISILADVISTLGKIF